VGLGGFLELSSIMIFFVGFVEEFVFRSALQTVVSEKLGRAKGLLVASLLFAFMNGGSHLSSEIIFAFFAGLVFGILFLKTSNLPLIAMAHDVTNISSS
jgi:membrane protease YdiL (CAAX protease family)